MSLRNVTIDDADNSGIIRYTQPNDNYWADQNCDGCLARPPDLSQVFDQTWHDTTYLPPQGLGLGAQFLFEGSAIYLYGIQANSTSGIVANNLLNFYLDDQPAGNYSHTPSNPNYTYNVNIFTVTGLEQGPHNLTMNLVKTSALLFDYMVYTTSTRLASSLDPPSASEGQTGQTAGSHSNHTGPIIGIVVGGLAGLNILIILIRALFFRKTFASVMPTSLKAGDAGTRTRRPALKLLAYFQRRDSILEVEPFALSLEERRQRENAPACPECGKGDLQKDEPQASSPPGGKASGSCVKDSVNPPSILPQKIAPPGLQRISSQIQSAFASRPISNPSFGANNSHGARDPIQGSTPIITWNPSLAGMIQGPGGGTPPPSYVTLSNSTH